MNQFENSDSDWSAEFFVKPSVRQTSKGHVNVFRLPKLYFCVKINKSKKAKLCFQKLPPHRNQLNVHYLIHLYFST